MRLITHLSFISLLFLVIDMPAHAQKLEEVKPAMSNTALQQFGNAETTNENNLQFKVGFIGSPPAPNLEWNRENFERLKELGFNTVQLNIAWAYRPGGEPLNLEDLIDVPEELLGATPMLGDQSPEKRVQRNKDLHQRSRLAKEMGFRTIFHFGVPYVGDSYYSDMPPNCLLDGKTIDRCVYLLREFAREFPEVDDILIYNYDQHAWLCSEFGPCPRCAGIPLSERLVPFLDTMKSVWRENHPDGRLWWEPWELSSGQLFQCIDRIDPTGLGLAIHCNAAEVMTAIPTDRMLKNTAQLAGEKGIPVIVEYFLGAASEEVEPYLNLAHPLATLRGLKEIARIPYVSGIKEYYGLMPDREDPNLRMTGLFFNQPDIQEAEALDLLAKPYGESAEAMKAFWRLTSKSVELFPWDCSWTSREIGKSDPSHSMSAALIRAVSFHTPSWMSTRRAVLMNTEPNENPDPWMLEDVQLRCEAAADCMEKALSIGRDIKEALPKPLAEDFEKNLEDLDGMWRRTRAYVYHIRETNLATSMRVLRNQGLQIPQRALDEMLAVLKADQANQKQDEPIASAVALLQKDPDEFLRQYFTSGPDKWSKGVFSLTSR